MSSLIFGITLLFAFQTATPEATFEVRRFPVTVSPAEQTYIIRNSSDAPALNFVFDGNLETGMRLQGDLIGPGLSQPHAYDVDARTRTMTLDPDQLKLEGTYRVTNLRLTSGGEVVAYAEPRSVTIEAINEILVTRVQARELSEAELQALGYIFNPNDYKTVEFQLALAMAAREEEVKVRVAVPHANDGRYKVIVLDDPFQPIEVLPLVKAPRTEPLESGPPSSSVGPQFNVFSLLLIPGNVTILKSHMAVTVLTANISGDSIDVSINNLKSELLLPNPTDRGFPLSMEGSPVKRVIHPGPDGLLGTGDDRDSLLKGEEAEVEYVITGELEGMHRVRAVVSGEVDLPQGKVKIHSIGEARVYIRPKQFNLIMEHPDAVAQGDAYDLYLHITNVGESLLDGLSVALPPATLIGTELDGSDPVQYLDPIPPGGEATIHYRMRSLITGKVIASYFKVDGEDSGALNLRVGIGESGENISSYSIRFPNSFEEDLPRDLVFQLRRYAKKLYDFAIMQDKEQPEGYLRPTKFNIDRLTQQWVTAVAMMNLGHDQSEVAAQLFASWVRSAYGLPRIDAYRRKIMDDGVPLETLLGDWLGELTASMSDTALRDLMAQCGSEADGLFLAVVDGADQNIVVTDASGHVTATGGPRGIPFSCILPLSPNRSLVWVSESQTPPTLQLEGSGVSASCFYRGKKGEFAWETGTNDDDPQTLFFDLDHGQLTVTSTDDHLQVLEAVPMTQTPFALEKVVQVDPLMLGKADTFGRTLLFTFNKPIDLSGLDPLAENLKINGQEAVKAAVTYSGRAFLVSAPMPLGPYKPIRYDLSGIKAKDGDTLGPQSGTAVPSSYFTGVSVSGRVVDHAQLPTEGARVFLFQKGEGLKLSILDGLSETGLPEGYINTDLGTHSTSVFAETTLDADGAYGFDFVSIKALQSSIDINASFFKIGILLPDGRYQERRYFPRGLSQEIRADFAFLAQGVVEGTVLNSQGEPIPYAPIYLINQNNVQTPQVTVCDENGNFSVDQVEVGPVMVKSKHENDVGYGSGYLTIADSPLTINVTIDQPQATLYGKVQLLDVDGSLVPIEDAFIGVLVNDTFHVIANEMSYDIGHTTGVRTAADGSYTLDGAPPGQAYLFVYHPRYSLKQLPVVLVEGDNGEYNFTYSRAEYEGGSVSGVVIDADGNPVADAEVQANSQIVRTDANGVFFIDGIPLFRETLVQARTTNLDTNASGGGHVFLDLEHRHFQDVLIQIYVPTRVNGVYLDSEGLPRTFVGIVIKPMESENGELRTFETSVTIGGGEDQLTTARGCKPAIVTNEEGRFSSIIDWKPDATYKISAANGKSIAHIEDVFIDRADPQFITLQQRPRGDITLQLQDAEGNPVVGEVSLTSEVPSFECDTLGEPTQRQLTKITNNEGTIVFEGVNAGPITIMANSILLGQRRLPGMEMTGEDMVIPVRFEAEELGSILGEVYDADGVTAAPAGTKVFAFVGITSSAAESNAPELNAQTTVGEDGYYIFPGLVQTESPTTVHMVFYNEDLDLFSESLVHMHGNLVYRNDAVLRKRGTVRARVVSSDGSPVDYAAVQLIYRRVQMRNTAAGWVPQVTKQPVIKQILPSEPYAVFEDIPSGPFQIKALGANGLTGVREFAVPVDGSEIEIAIRLEAASSISGTFLDHDDTPIANGEVQLHQFSFIRPELLASMLTGESGEDLGRFAFTNIPMRTYTLQGIDPGSGHLATQHVTTSPYQPNVNIDLKLDPVIDLTGILYDNQGNPVPGAHLVLRSKQMDVPFQTGTDADGRYTFYNLREGDYSLVADKRGINGKAAGAVTLVGQNGDVVDRDLYFERTVELTFNVLNVEGSPAANVMVSILESNYGQHLAFSNDQGQVIFRGVTMGKYVVNIESPELNMKTFTRMAITASDPDQTERTVQLQRYGAVYGYVRDQLDRPLGHAASVNFAYDTFVGDLGDVSEITRTVNTDVDGYFRMGNLPVDKPIKVRAYNPITYEWDHTTVQLSQHLEEKEAPLTFRVSTSVSGHVSYADGTPAQKAFVRIKDPIVYEVQTDEQGFYYLDVVPSGSIEVSATEYRGARRGQTTINITPNPDGSMPIPTNVDIVMPGIGDITGLVRYSNGETVINGHVTLDGPGGRRIAPIYGDGSYRFKRMPLGTYTLKGVDGRYSRTTPELTVVLDTDGGVFNRDLFLEQDFTLNGSVLDSSGALLPGANLELWYFDGRTYERKYAATANEQGYYTIERVFPGQYRLDAHTDNLEQALSRVIQLNGDITGEVMPLQARSWIIGNVVDSAGLPFDSGSVTVTQGADSYRTYLNSDGSFSLYGLLPIAYEMTVKTSNGWIEHTSGGFLDIGLNTMNVDVGATVTILGQTYFESLESTKLDAYLMTAEGVRRYLDLDASGQFSLGYVPVDTPLFLNMQRGSFQRTVALGSFNTEVDIGLFVLDGTPPQITMRGELPATVYAGWQPVFDVVDSEPDTWIDDSRTQVWLNNKDITHLFTSVNGVITGDFTQFPQSMVRGENTLRVRAFNHSHAVKTKTLTFNADQDGTNLTVKLMDGGNAIAGEIRFSDGQTFTVDQNNGAYFPNFQAGSYHLKATDNIHGTRETMVVTTDKFSQSFTMNLREYGNYMGRLVDPEGSAIAGAVVHIGDFTETTAADGTFVFDLLKLGIQHRLDVTVGDLSLHLEPERLLLNQQTILLGDLVMLGRGSVNGLVLDENRAPMPNLPVTLQYTGSGRHLPSLETTSAADGSYQFTDVATYTFTVSAREPSTARLGVATGRLEQPGQVDFVEITLSETARVSGVLVDETGVPLADFPVGFTAKRTGWTGQVLTAADGSFEMEGLPRANMELLAIKDNTHFARYQFYTDVNPDRNVGVIQLRLNQPPEIHKAQLPEVWEPAPEMQFSMNLTDDYGLDRAELTFDEPYAQTWKWQLDGTTVRSTSTSIKDLPDDLPEGIINYTFIATDGLGATATQTGSIQVAHDVAGPSLTLNQPAAGQTFAEGEPLRFEGLLSEPSGVNSLEIYLNEALHLAKEFTSSGGARSFDLNTYAPAVDAATDVTYTMVARDNQGHLSTNTVTIHVTPITSSEPPTVEILSLAEGQPMPISMEPALELPLVATLSDAVGLAAYSWVVNGTEVASGPLFGPFVTQESQFTIPIELTLAEIVEVALTVTNLSGEQTTQQFLINDIQGTVLDQDTVITTFDTSYDDQTLILAGGTHTIDGEHTFDNLILVNGATVTQTATNADETIIAGTQISVTDHLVLGYGATFDMINKGFRRIPLIFDMPNSGLEALGGTFAGLGKGHTQTDLVYGSPFQPTSPGSGSGGGAIKLSGPQLWILGDVVATSRSDVTHGTGGSIWVAADQFHGKGRLLAHAYPLIEESQFPNDGSGGRIAIYGQFEGQVNAMGGEGAGSGTIYRRIPDPLAEDGFLDTLEINGRGADTIQNVTPLPVLLNKVVGTDLTISTENNDGQTVQVLNLGNPAILQPDAFLGYRVSAAGSFNETAVIDRQNATRLLSQPGQTFGAFTTGDVINIDLAVDQIIVRDGARYEALGRPLRGSILVENAGLSGRIETPLGDADLTWMGEVSLDGAFDLGSFTLDDSSTFTLTGSMRADSFTLTSGTHYLNGALESGSLTVNDGATLSTPQQTYNTSMTVNAPLMVIDGNLESRSTGSSVKRQRPAHGGLAGGEALEYHRGTTYGSLYRPTAAGAIFVGVNNYAGGSIHLIFDTLFMNGGIHVDTEVEKTSPGSIFLEGGPGSTLRGSGVLNATIPDGGYSYAGGGRIAIHVDTMTDFSGSMSVKGHKPEIGLNAGAGTIFLRTLEFPNGKLLIDNEGMASFENSTPLPGLGTVTVTETTGDGPVITGSGFVDSPVGLYVEVPGYDPVRIADYTATTLIAEPGTNFPPLNPGDTFSGLHKLDVLEVRGNAQFYSPDPIELTHPAIVNNGGSIGETVIRSPQVSGPTVITDAEVTLVDTSITELVLNNATATVEVPLNLTSLTLNAGSTLIYQHGMSSTTVTVDGGTLICQTRDTFRADNLTMTGNALWTVAEIEPSESAWPLIAEINGLLRVEADATITTSGENRWTHVMPEWLPDRYDTYGHGGFSTRTDAREQPPMGSFAHPNLAGSAAGGGVIRLTANELQSDGAIKADGGQYSGHTGSGGSIEIHAQTLSGNGLISASGPTYHHAGGRIAVYYHSDRSFMETMDFRLFSPGITSSSIFFVNYAGAGTLFLKSADQTYGELIVDQQRDQLENPDAKPDLDIRQRLTGITGPAQWTLGLDDADPDPRVIRDQSTINLPPGLAGLYAAFDDNGVAREIEVIDNTHNAITLAEPVTDLLPAGVTIRFLVKLDKLSLRNGANFHFNGVIQLGELERMGTHMNSIWCSNLVLPNPVLALDQETFRLRLDNPQWDQMDVTLNQSKLVLDQPITLRDLTLVQSALSHTQWTTSFQFAASLVSIDARHVVLDAESRVDVTNLSPKSSPFGFGETSHGGYQNGQDATVHDNLFYPHAMGAGFGGGGGVVKIHADTIQGGTWLINSDAGTAGALQLEAQSYSGDINLHADGKQGGGRISVRGDRSTANLTATAYTTSTRDPLGPGSILFKDETHPFGVLKFANDPSRNTIDTAVVTTFPTVTLVNGFSAVYDPQSGQTRLQLNNLDLSTSYDTLTYVEDYAGYHLVINGDVANPHLILSSSEYNEDALFIVEGDLSLLTVGDTLDPALILDEIQLQGVSLNPKNVYLLDSRNPWLDGWDASPSYDGNLIESEPFTLTLQPADHVYVHSMIVEFEGQSQTVEGPGPHTFAYTAPATTEDATATVRVTILDPAGNTHVEELSLNVGPPPTPPYEGELVIDGGAENGGIDGWTLVSGNWSAQTSGSSEPYEGSAYFVGVGQGDVEIYRQIDLTAWREMIDRGLQPFSLSAQAASIYATATFAIALDFTTATGAVIQTETTPWMTKGDDWIHLFMNVMAPAGARGVRVRLLGRSDDTATMSVYFDAISLSPLPPISAAGHNVALTDLIAPESALIGAPFQITGNLANIGTFQESNPAVVLFDETTGASWTLEPAPVLEIGAAVPFTFTHNLIDDLDGMHQFRLVAESLTDEVDTSDNTVSFQVMMTRPEPSYNTQLVTNGSAEYGPIEQDWVIDGALVRTDYDLNFNAAEGDWYFQMNSAADVYQDINLAAFSSQIDAGNQIFHMSGFLRTNSNTNPSARLQMTFLDASGTALSTTSSQSLTESSAWRPVGFIATAPVGSRVLRARLQNQCSSNPCTSYVDAVQLSAIDPVAEHLPQPAAWWSFDNTDLNGETVYDMAGANHGVNLGATLGQPGIMGQALAFQDNVVEIPHSETLAPENAFSIQAWIYPTSIGNYGALTLIKPNGTTPGYALGQKGQDSKYRFSYTSGSEQAVDFPGRLPLNTWHHLMMVSDGNVLTTYYNGRAVAQEPISGLLSPGNEPLYIGGHGRDNNKYFRGIIDEVAFWNEPLTPAVVVDLYRRGIQGQSPRLMLDTSPPIIAEPIVDPLVNGSLTSGQTFTVTVTMDERNPESLTAVFNGDSQTQNGAGPFVFTFTAPQPSADEIQTLSLTATDIKGQVANLTRDITILAPDTQAPVVVILGPEDGGEILGGSPFQVDVQATDNTAIQRISAEFNGLAQDHVQPEGVYETQVVDAFNFTMADTAQTLTVTVVDLAGNQSQTSIQLNPGASQVGGPVAYYSFDNADYVSYQLRDVSGNGLHSHYSNPYSYGTTGMVGQAFIFKSTDREITVNGHPLLDLSQSFTLSAFVKIDSFLENGGIMVYGDADQSAYGLTTRSDKTVVFNVANQQMVSQPLTTGTWYHVAATFFGGQARLYVDGVEVASGSMSTSAAPILSAPWLTLGSNPHAAKQTFNGRLDEVIIFNGALTPAAVLDLNDKWRAGTLEDYRAPEAVENLRVTDLTDSEISLAWDASANSSGDLTGYVIHKDGIEAGTVPSNQTNYTLTGLNPGVSYDIQIGALDAVGNLSRTSIQMTTLSATPITRPSSWWTMDNADTQSTQMKDAMGLRPSNNFSVSWGSTGIRNQGYRFTSSTYRIEVPDTEPLVTGDQWSISFWIKTSDFNNRTIFAYGSATSEFLAARLQDDGENGLRLLFEANDGADQLKTGSIPANDGHVLYELTKNEWTHVALTIDQGQVRSFINGREESSATWPTNVLQTPEAAWLSLGRSPKDGAYFGGNFDEFMVWDHALNQGEVNLLYHAWKSNLDLDIRPPVAPADVTVSATSTTLSVNWSDSPDAVAYQITLNDASTIQVAAPLTTAIFTDLPPYTFFNITLTATDEKGNRSAPTKRRAVTLPSGPNQVPLAEAYWTFDNADHTSGKVKDALNRHHGNYGYCSYGRTGVVNQAFGFTSSTYRSEVPDPNGMIDPSHWSLSMWIKPANFSNRALVSHISAAGETFGLNLTNSGGNQLSLDIGGATFLTGADVAANGVAEREMNTNTWYHVVLVYETSRIKLYLDGEERLDEAATLAIQDDAWLSFGKNSFRNIAPSADIDEAVLWKQAIDETAIILMYQTQLAGAPFDLKPPEDVTDLAITSTSDSLTLAWTASPNTAGDLAGYRVQIEGQPSQTVAADQTGLTVTGLTPATLYQVTVDVVDHYGNTAKGVTMPAGTRSNVAGAFPQPASWYSFDNGDHTSTRPYDLMGFRNATYGYGGTGSTALLGQSFNLTSSSYRVEVPDIPAFFDDQVMTTALWVRPSYYNTKGVASFGSTTEEVFAFITLQQSSDVNNRIAFTMGSHQLEAGAVMGANGYPVEQMERGSRWYHLAASYDHGLIKLYLDGELVAETTVSDGLLTRPQDAMLVFGKRPFTNDGGGVYLDDAAVWRTALTDHQIALLHQTGRAGHDFRSTTLDLTPPEPATNVTVTSTENDLDLMWTPSLDTAGDLLDYQVFVDGSHVADVPAAQTSVNIPGLASATVYQIEIIARDTNLNQSPATQLHAATQSPAGLPSPVSYWSFDVNKSSSFVDYVGSNDTTYFYGGHSTAWMGYGLNVSSSSYFAEVNPADLALTNGLTVSTWIKISSFSAAGGGVIAYGTDAGEIFSIVTMNDDGNYFRFQSGGDSVRTTTAFGGNGYVVKEANINTWYHLAVVFNNGAASIYMDGELMGSAAWANTTLPTPDAPILTFGKNHIGTDVGGRAYIDETAIWNQVLSPSDVLVAYHRGLRGQGMVSTTRGKSLDEQFESSDSYFDHDAVMLVDEKLTLSHFSTNKALWIYRSDIRVEGHLIAPEIHLMEGSTIVPLVKKDQGGSTLIKADRINIDNDSAIRTDGLANDQDVDPLHLSPVYPSLPGKGPRGGGAVQIQSKGLYLNGEISARGLEGSDGGSVLIQTDLILGKGAIDVRGDEAGGQGGHVAIHANNGFSGTAFSGEGDHVGMVVYRQPGLALAWGDSYPFTLAKRGNGNLVMATGFEADQIHSGRNGSIVEVPWNPIGFLGLSLINESGEFEIVDIKRVGEDAWQMTLDGNLPHPSSEFQIVLPSFGPSPSPERTRGQPAGGRPPLAREIIRNTTDDSNHDRKPPPNPREGHMNVPIIPKERDRQNPIPVKKDKSPVDPQKRSGGNESNSPREFKKDDE